MLPPGLIQEFNPAPDTMPGVSRQSVFSVNAIGMRGSECPEEDRFSTLAVHAYNKVLLDACENRGVSCVDLVNQLPKDTTVF